jgi:spore germination protein
MFEVIMDIHVVQFGETIDTIAEQYGVSAQKIISDNELINPYRLVIGQTIVITYPEKTYTVQEGDTLISIADSNGISVIQLLRNNSFLSERTYIYPGETLVISYNNTKRKVTTSGFAYPYINKSLLVKTLPYLTYLSIFNYTITSTGELITYYDDLEIIQIAKDYGVAPLMLVTTLTAKGEPNIEAAYDILINEELQEQYIYTILGLVKSKGYYGVNLSFQYLNTSNQDQYINLFNKASEIANLAGIPLFITINPNKTFVGNELVYERVDLTRVNQDANSIAFVSFNWAYNYGPPIPIASINDIKDLIDYVLNYVRPETVNVGIPIFGYDWELPYVPGFTKASALSLNSIINLAVNIGAVIEFDEISQTPYIRYIESANGIQHIIWFIDARSINSLMNLVVDSGLQGTGIWNIMYYYAQMWLIINSQYEIESILL